MRYDTQREVLYAFLMKKDGIAGGGLVSTGGTLYYFPRDIKAVVLATWWYPLNPEKDGPITVEVMDFDDKWTIGTIAAWRDLKRLVPVFAEDMDAGGCNGPPEREAGEPDSAGGPVELII